MLIEKHYIENYGLFLRGHTDIITTLSVSCDNKYIVTGSLDCTVRLWDFSEHRQIQESRRSSFSNNYCSDINHQ